MSPLERFRIVEIATETAAAFCGRIVTDLGMQVIVTEPVDGHPRRLDEPCKDGASARFLYLSRGKRRVTVTSDDEITALIDGADAIITDLEPAHIDSLIVGHPIIVHIRPYGATGPMADCKAHHLTVFHSAGEGSTLPSGRCFDLFPDRAPLQLGSDVAYFDAGWHAAVALLACLCDMRRGGRPQSVDVSIQECQLTLNRTRMNRFLNEAVVHGRERVRHGVLGMVRCADGWAQIGYMHPEHWERLLEVPTCVALRAHGAALGATETRGGREYADALEAWCRSQSKYDVVKAISDAGAPAGIFADPDDLLASEQLAHRGFFQTADGGALGPVVVPGVPYHVKRAAVAHSDPRPSHGRMLEGLRVLDFTWAAAGPYATLLLGFLGADVIKIESRRRIDPARTGFVAAYENIDESPIFNELALNKRSVDIDLTTAEGVAAAKRLAGQADVVVDNFRPGVMNRLGLGAEDLLALNPRLVVACSSANGSSGPDSMAAGVASVFAATGGLSHQTGYRDGPPTEVGDPMDYRSGAALAAAIVAGLLEASVSGGGQIIDLSSREVVIASAPDALLARSLGIDWEPRIGNGHRTMSLHDVYACRDGGWVAVAVADDERDALQRILGMTCDEEPALVEWVAARTASDAARELQAAGIAASSVMAFDDLALGTC